MMELKKFKLGEIGEVCMCKRIMKEETNTVSGIPFYKIGTFGNAPDAYISREKFEDYKRLYSFPKKGDILISAAGTIGRTVVFDGKDAYFQDSNIVWIDNDETKVLNRYLYYCYKNIRWYTSNGSTILRLYNDNIKNSEILVPDLLTQKQIVSVLSSLDRKIALNRAINRNLEALAKQLYDYWFVQFDFPDENGRPYKSSGGKMVWNEALKREVPKGWEVKRIGEVLGRVKSTPRLVTDEYLNEGKYPIIDQTRTIYYAGFTNREDAVLNQFPAVVFGDHSCAVKYVNFPFARGADGTQILIPNDERVTSEFLYFVVQNVKLKEGYARHFSLLKDSAFVLPSIAISKMYAEIVVPYFEQIKHNRHEIITLTHQRDELLPLLMNGQVTIE